MSQLLENQAAGPALLTVDRGMAELWAHRSLAYLLAIRITLRPALAEEALQEAYLHAWRAIRGGKRPQTLKTWFLRVTANCAKAVARAETRRSRREERVRTATGPTPAEDGPALREGAALLAGALERLEMDYRLPLSLCYEQGLSQTQAGEILNLTPQAVNRRIQTGLLKLRALLKGSNLALPASALPEMLRAEAERGIASLPPDLEQRLQTLQAQVQSEPPGTGLRSNLFAGGPARGLVWAAATLALGLAGVFLTLQAPSSGPREKPPQTIPERQASGPDLKGSDEGLVAMPSERKEWRFEFEEGLPDLFEPSGEVSWSPHGGLDGSGALAFGNGGGAILTRWVLDGTAGRLDLHQAPLVATRQLDLRVELLTRTHGVPADPPPAPLVFPYTPRGFEPWTWEWDRSMILAITFRGETKRAAPIERQTQAQPVRLRVTGRNIVLDRLVIRQLPAAVFGP